MAMQRDFNVALKWTWDGEESKLNESVIISLLWLAFLHSSLVALPQFSLSSLWTMNLCPWQIPDWWAWWQSSVSRHQETDLEFKLCTQTTLMFYCSPPNHQPFINSMSAPDCSLLNFDPRKLSMDTGRFMLATSPGANSYSAYCATQRHLYSSPSISLFAITVG